MLRFFVFLAARTVDIRVLLASQIAHDSPQFGREVPLRTMELKWLDVSGELPDVYRILISLVAMRSSSCASCLCFLLGPLLSFSFFFAKLDQSFLMLAKLVL